MRGPDGRGCFNTRKYSGGGGSVPASEQNALTPASRTAMQARGVRVTALSPSASPWHTIRLLGGLPPQGEWRACLSWDPTWPHERRNSPPPDFPAHTKRRRTQRLREAICEYPPARELPLPSSENAIPSPA